MPPSGVSGVMDEDALIEAEIIQELEQLNLHNDDYNNEDDNDHLYENIQEDQIEDDNIPPELDNYLQYLQQQRSKFEKELEECDEVLHYTSNSTGNSQALVPLEDVQLLEKAAWEAGEDPKVFRRRILEEIENERDNDSLDNNEDIFLKAGIGSGQVGEADEKALVLLDENQLQFQKMLKEKMAYIENIHKEREEKLKIELEEEKLAEEKFHQQEEEDRRKRRLLVEQEVMTLAKERLVQQEILEQEEKQKMEETEKEIKRYEDEIRQLAEEVEKEKKQLEETIKEEESKQVQKQERAAIKIQSVYRGHSVRKVYSNILKEKIDERRKLIVAQKVKEAELKIEQRRKEIEAEKEAERRELEEREREKKRQEEENRQKEIQIKKEEEMRQRIQEEKEEEEKRKQEIKLEKERKKKEEEEKRIQELKLEKERKDKEEEEKRKQEIKLEKERKKKEEEERKAVEKRSKEQEKKKQEIRIEEERRRKEEEERKQKEQVKLEEEKRKKEEERKAEVKGIEERKKQDHIRLEDEKKKKENEERKADNERKEDQKRLEQTYSKTTNQDDSKKKEEKAIFNNEEIDLKRMAKIEEKEHQKTRTEECSEVLMLETQQHRMEEKLEAENKDVKNKNIETVRDNLSCSKNQQEDENENKSLFARNKQNKSGERSEMGGATGDVSDSDEDDLMVLGPEEDSKRKSTSTLNVMMHGLTDSLEKQRIHWIRQCVPWSKISNEPWKLKTDTGGKRAPRRPSSAKKLLPLEDHVITSAAHVQTLRQVTTVKLEDLPGCSVTTLGQCWGLESLSMKKCNLITVEGLGQCKKLKYLDFQDNYIQYLELKELGSLIYLNLSHNKISSVHGLDGCINLRWLIMSHNKVTRIGGMNTLRRLHTLDLSRNQLISTQGLSDTPTLQSLNLSHNHLQGCEDMTKLCLLQHLNLSSNNLLTLTDLQNQVLLQELCVEDNSITDIKTMKQMWLPLLQTLNLGQNSLEDLVAIDHLHILKTVDISNNQIIDIDVILNSLEECFYLAVVNIDGNPITEESSQIKDKFREKFPRLRSLDDTVLKEYKETPIKPRNSYEAMCFTQVQLVQEINKQFEEDLRSLRETSPLDLDKICKTFFTFCDKTYQVAVDFRYAHEYSEITMAVPVAPSVPKSGNRPRSARSKPGQKEGQYLSPKDLFEKVVQISKDAVNDQTSVQASRTSLTGKVIGDQSEAESESEALQLLRERSAIKIQAAWRGYSIRRDQMYERRQPDLDIDLRVIEELHQAATKIQAVWRGYNLRCKLERALEFARFDDEDDFEFDEVDLGEFNFDEDMLNDWKPPETPQIPPSHPIIGKPPSGKINNLPPLDKVPGLKLDGPHPPSQPRRAWRGSDSPLSDVITPHNRPRPPSSLASGPLTVLDSHRSGMSKKEEKLSEEWGFRDNQTAHLMMQRAKKMKYNSERRKKLSKLDPKQRLALFRKLEETTSIRTVKPPSRTTLPRKEYFQARQQEIEMKEVEKRNELSNRKNRTFEWIHTQVGDYETTDSCINQQRRFMYGSEGNLPKLDSEVTAGRPARLTGSPVSMDIQSMDSVSMTGEFSKPRRMSAGSNGSMILPEIKTGSAPSTRTKEKMSWRNPVQRSIGWGGGKKRPK